MVSIIVCFYERLDHLRCCLDSIQLSSEYFDEVIITDDGSCETTVSELKKIIQSYDFPVRHIWQEKKGFRNAAARNNGIRHAKGDYLIFFDCDFLVLPQTIPQHLKRAKLGKFIAGGYKNMDEATTQEAFHTTLTADFINGLDVRLPERPLIKTHRRFIKRTLLMRLRLAAPQKQSLGGHFPTPQPAREPENGTDQNWGGGGGEDEDLGIRLVRAGIHCRSAIRHAKVLHLWHPPAITDRRWQEGPNIQYFNRKEIPVFCINGLQKPAGEA
jgi:glycosyltransferase involved in cell wall biosynthesis